MRVFVCMYVRVCCVCDGVYLLLPPIRLTHLRCLRASSRIRMLPPPGSLCVGVGCVVWRLCPQPQYDEIFFSSGPVNGKLTGAVARNVLMSTGVPVDTLGRIWELADMDRDGELDGEEFAVAMHLINLVLAGGEVPVQLAVSMIPPSKRNFMIQQ